MMQYQAGEVPVKELDNSIIVIMDCTKYKCDRTIHETISKAVSLIMMFTGFHLYWEPFFIFLFLYNLPFKN